MFFTKGRHQMPPLLEAPPAKDRCYPPPSSPGTTNEQRGASRCLVKDTKHEIG